MPSQYEIGQSDEGPKELIRRYGRWSPLWDAVVKAFDEGYKGWIVVKLPNHEEAKNAAGAFFHRRKYYQRPAECSYRKQDDGTYFFYARLSPAEGVSDA